MTNNKKTFSSTEVGTLVESLRGDVQSVAEGVTYLRNDMDDVKTRLSTLEVEVRSMKDAVYVAIPSLSKRVTVLESKVGV